MKNIELYRTIEALVQAKRQQFTPGKPSFAHDYCKQQIQKKKLVPFNPKSKMNRIMKNFHSLDTYVNVEQLFQYINMLIAQRQKEDIKIHPHIKWKSKQKIPENDYNDYQIIDKVREKLGPYNQKIFLKENAQMWGLISRLQEESNVGSYRKQNSPNNDDINFYIQNTKQKQEDKKFASDKEQWRFYEGNNYVFQDLSQRKFTRSPQIQKLIFQQPSLKKRQQKRELIHQVSTYLQIILQHHHKKKWGKKKTSVDDKQNQSLLQTQTQSKVKEKKIQFKIHRLNSRNTQYKSAIQNTQYSTQKSSLNNSFLELKKKPSNKSVSRAGALSHNNSFISRKNGVNQNFTFRNRNIKEGLMKKIDEFLDFVENQQKQFKKEKNNSMNQLIYLQNKQKNNHRFGEKTLVVDDHQIKAVQSVVHLQK